jgi:hypothetical protein
VRIDNPGGADASFDEARADVTGVANVSLPLFGPSEVTVPAGGFIGPVSAPPLFVPNDPSLVGSYHLEAVLSLDDADLTSDGFDVLVVPSVGGSQAVTGGPRPAPGRPRAPSVPGPERVEVAAVLGATGGSLVAHDPTAPGECAPRLPSGERRPEGRRRRTTDVVAVARVGPTPKGTCMRAESNSVRSLAGCPLETGICQPVPGGVPPGVYSFAAEAIRDGAVVARDTSSVEVQ